MRLKKAIKILIKNLEKDKEYYYSWQSNIAMAFYDEYRKRKKRNKYVNIKELHKISNEAAINFLNLLIKMKRR